MSTESRETRILFACVYLGVPFVYTLWRLLPYLLFYLLPFLACSLFLGSLWALLTRQNEGHPSSLGFAIPVTFIAVFLYAGFPKEPSLLKNSTPVIESLFLFDWFNGIKANSNGLLSSLMPQFLAPKIPPPKIFYDFNDVRWILWISFGIGAPAAFALFTKKQVDAVTKIIEAKYERITSENRDELAAAYKERANNIQSTSASLHQMETERDHFRSEYAKLKTLFEFQKKVDHAATWDEKSSQPKGVLDSDLL